MHTTSRITQKQFLQEDVCLGFDVKAILARENRPQGQIQAFRRLMPGI